MVASGDFSIGLGKIAYVHKSPGRHDEGAFGATLIGQSFIGNSGESLKRLLKVCLSQIGKGLGHLLPWRNPSQLFFFETWPVRGAMYGAERVHSMIGRSVSDKAPWVFSASSQGRTDLSCAS